MIRVAFILACSALARCEQASVASKVNMLLEHLAGLELAGEGPNTGIAKGRTMIVEHLLSGITSEEAITPPVAAVIQQIRDLFQVILTDFLADKVQDNIELNSSVGDWHHCADVEFDDRDMQYEKFAEDAAIVHKECRDSQDMRYWTLRHECEQMRLWLNSQSPPTCSPMPVSDVSSISDWYTLIDHEIWFEGKVSMYKKLEKECEQQMILWDDRKHLCDNAQDTFEAYWCLYAGERHRYCNDREVCYNGTTWHYDQARERLGAIARRRVEDARRIHFMDCLLDELVKNITSITDWKFACQHEWYEEHREFDLNYPRLPLAVNCSVVDVTPFPGHPQWYHHRYSNLPGNSPAYNSGLVCQFAQSFEIVTYDWYPDTILGR